MADIEDDAREFAELLQRLDQESLELVRAAANRLQRDHDGSFTAKLDEPINAASALRLRGTRPSGS